jgi:hypothetical protein
VKLAPRHHRAVQTWALDARRRDVHGCTRSGRRRESICGYGSTRRTRLRRSGLVMTLRASVFLPRFGARLRFPARGSSDVVVRVAVPSEDIDAITSSPRVVFDMSERSETGIERCMVPHLALAMIRGNQRHAPHLCGLAMRDGNRGGWTHGLVKGGARNEGVVVAAWGNVVPWVHDCFVGVYQNHHPDMVATSNALRTQCPSSVWMLTHGR